MTFTLVGSIANSIIFILTTIGLPGLLALMIVESFGIPPVPSEIILPFTGFLIVTGVFPLLPAIALALAGGLIGSYAAFAVGWWWRDRITGMGIGPFRLEERHLARVDGWFARHGEATVLLCRMVPVVRSYISYPAGSARMEPVRFGVFTLVGTIPFTLGLIYGGMLLGSHWNQIEQDFSILDYVLVALLVVGVVYFLVLLVRRGREVAPPSERTSPTATAPAADLPAPPLPPPDRP
ncbi:MAG TPA: DedA family protein [Thermoplasmata archaeon]|nr:DedA family protein [Thermoplasmata archaeon]